MPIILQFYCHRVRNAIRFRTPLQQIGHTIGKRPVPIAPATRGSA